MSTLVQYSLIDLERESVHVFTMNRTFPAGFITYAVCCFHAAVEKVLLLLVLITVLCNSPPFGKVRRDDCLSPKLL